MNLEIDNFILSRSPNSVSVRKIAKVLKIKRRKVSGYIKKSGKFVNVDPLMNGSNKATSTCWKLK